jgi:hypothetical protein
VGTDFMASWDDVIDFECGQFLISGNRKVTRGYTFLPTGHIALTIFSEGKAGRNLFPSWDNYAGV